MVTVTESTSIASLPPADRIISVDRLRILAAFGIVWFHTTGAPGRQIAYAGLPIFLLIFFSLLVKKNHAGTTKRFLRRRWERLLKPWIFWSVVYGLCKLLNAVRTADTGVLDGMLSPAGLLAGTHIHLWYLPYAFVTGLVVFGLDHSVSKTWSIGAILVSVGVAILTLIVCAIHLETGRTPAPLAQWEFGLAALPLGFALGRCHYLPTIRSQRLFFLLMCLVISATCLLLTTWGYGELAVPYGLGFALVCGAYVWPGRADVLTLAIAPLTFGVYLIHPLVAHVLGRLLPAGMNCALFVALTATLSGLIAWVLRETPGRKLL